MNRHEYEGILLRPMAMMRDLKDGTEEIAVIPAGVQIAFTCSDDEYSDCSQEDYERAAIVLLELKKEYPGTEPDLQPKD